jgi:histidinol-phosphate aminotransferase
VLRQPMPEVTGFQLNILETTKLVRRQRPRGIFLCNPNNPTGQYLSAEEFREIMSSASESLLILDEAYIAFTADTWSSLDLIHRGNLMVLRSMTKDYALAGLRLGYAIAGEPIISVLRKVKPPWNVSSVAQKAGIYALEADGYLDTCRKNIKEAKDFLVAGLKGLGLAPLPSQTNFFLVKVGDAAGFRQAMLRKGILVRDCTSFGLPDYIRLAPCSMAECQILLTAVKEVRHHAS